MKKINYAVFIFTSVLLASFYAGFSGFTTPESIVKQEQSAKTKFLAGKITELKNSGKVFEEKNILNKSNNSQQNAVLSAHLKSFTSLKLDKSKAMNLLGSKPEYISFTIPNGSEGTMTLELFRVDVLAEGFRAGTLSGNGEVNYTNYSPGLYYRGIIKGDNESFASLSVFSDFVMAVASNKQGNWNLSSIKDNGKMYTEDYVFYNDVNLITGQDFECGVNDDNNIFDKRHLNWQRQTQGDNPPPQLVRKYFECDFKMYQDFGSNTTNVNNYVTAFFNSCAAMYAQDSINTSIQNIFVWTSADPYIGITDNTRILKIFGGRTQNSFNGDLAHWVSTRTDIGGGIAWVGVLCEPFNTNDSSGRYAVSVIDNQHVPFPTYSWVVNVVVHEMGHNLGSNHTHSCTWPGGPIDSCYPVEGGCYSGAQIPRVGTVMSYCHLNASVNLALGFGPLPGDTIRANVSRAGCLPIGITPISNILPGEFMLQQNYPNPFNPVTNIRFSIPKSGNVRLIVYDIAGKQVAELVNGELSAGEYNADFDASGLASGVYFYELITSEFTGVKKMVLIK